MANQEHLDLLNQGSTVWNKWRERHRDIKPDLSDADLNGAELDVANLRYANLRGVYLNNANLNRADLCYADLDEGYLEGTHLIEADLGGAYLGRANLNNADLSGAELSETYCGRASFKNTYLNGADFSRANCNEAQLNEACLIRAYLSEANFGGANLRNANLDGAYLYETYLLGADLSSANLNHATFIRTNFTNAVLNNCQVYGVSTWDIQLNDAQQDNLLITPSNQSPITVDNLKVAQFIYLLLNNEEIRDAIDTIAKKAVLILGRFSDKRKPVLEALRTTLRSKGYLPILFDFEKPRSQDLTETVSILAHLSKFIIADLTEPSSVPHELATIIPNHVVPVIPLFHPTDQARHEYAMFQDLGKRHKDWVLPIHHYIAIEDLLSTLQSHIIEPAEKRVRELVIFKNTPEAK
jgi:uncharacterized protein YjbI with pentapeptide repeats